MESAFILAILASLTGKLDVPERANACLAYVRIVVEEAYGMAPFEFYTHFGVRWSSMARVGRTDFTWRAADIEASMRELGFTVPYEQRRAGDLVFNYRSLRPYGHVGILISPDLMAESIGTAPRPHSLEVGRYLRVTPLHTLGVTSVVRLPPRDEIL